MSDMTLQWLHDNGATSPSIVDAWAEMLDFQGAVGARNDAWFELLGTLGFTDGSISEREAAFWEAGGNLVQLGPDLITNGGFDADTDWTKGTGWLIANGLALVFTPLGANSDMTPTVANTTALGTTYRLRFFVDNIQSGALDVFLGTAPAISLGTGPHNRYYIADVTAAANNASVIFRGLTGFQGAIDNVSLKEIL
jgi:hypothetical protein